MLRLLNCTNEGRLRRYLRHASSQPQSCKISAFPCELSVYAGCTPVSRMTKSFAASRNLQTKKRLGLASKSPQLDWQN